MPALIEEIREYEALEVLSRELPPTTAYWHWEAVQPERLPQRLVKIYDEYGEIRWYGGYDY